MTHETLMSLADAYAEAYRMYMRPDAARAALSDALMKVVQDAERYRWLRDSELGDGAENIVSFKIVMLDDFGAETIARGDMDLTIDIAMKEPT